MNLDRAIAAVAAKQHGLFTLEQARDRGATRSRIATRRASKRWVRLHPTVFAVAGAPDTWRRRVLAAVLAAGPGATASHATAAALHGIEGFSPRGIEITLPAGRRPRVKGAVLHHTHHPVSVARVDGIPVTDVPQTVADVAHGCGPELVERAVDDVLRRRLTTYERLATAAAQAGGRRGVRALRTVLGRRSSTYAPRESALERAFERAISGLPEPVAQFVVRDGSRFVARIDFAYPDRMLAIEVEGDGSHSTPEDRARDARRRNALALRGWTVIIFTWSDVFDRPQVVRATIAAALRRTGFDPAV